MLAVVLLLCVACALVSVATHRAELGRRLVMAPRASRITFATGLVIADRVRLPFTMLEPLVEHARAERLIEVKGSVGSGTG